MKKNKTLGKFEVSKEKIKKSTQEIKDELRKSYTTSSQKSYRNA